MVKNLHEIRIGISSSHGTGKTTLSNSLSKVLRQPILTSDLKIYWERWGITDFNVLTREKRTEYQWKLLECYMADRMKHLKSNNGFISDRTPYDFWGYTDVSSSMKRIHKFLFWNLVKSSARLHRFDYVVFLKPEFPMVNEKNRGELSVQKQVAESVKRCLFGLFDKKRIIQVSGSNEDRVLQILTFINKNK